MIYNLFTHQLSCLNMRTLIDTYRHAKNIPYYQLCHEGIEKKRRRVEFKYYTAKRNFKYLFESNMQLTEWIYISARTCRNEDKFSNRIR